jgi:hypothetical protein
MGDWASWREFDYEEAVLFERDAYDKISFKVTRGRGGLLQI